MQVEVSRQQMDGERISRVSLAVFYGAGIGLAMVSYLARSGIFRFKYHAAFKGSVTVIDVLGYPKQQEMFWLVVGILLPLSVGLLYGLIERRRAVSTLRGWWAALALLLAQSPALMIEAWSGFFVATLHIVILITIPVLTGKGLPDATGGQPAALLPYRPSNRFVPVVALILFTGFISHLFLTMNAVSIMRVVFGTLVWSASFALFYFILFRLLEIKFPLNRNCWDRGAWGLMPVVLLPIYQLAWCHPRLYVLMLFLAALTGAILFIRPPSWNATKAASVFLPLGIGMAFFLNPLYRFFYLDLVHEGQQLAFAQCVLRGMLPGVEKAVKYGPLYELSEGWSMKLFGAQITVLRVYTMWTRVLGYLFGCLLIAELVRRRLIVMYG